MYNADDKKYIPKDDDDAYEDDNNDDDGDQGLLLLRESTITITTTTNTTALSPITIVPVKPPKYVGSYVLYETLGKGKRSFPNAISTFAGAWGKVRRGEHLETREPVAIKIIYRYVLDRKLKDGLAKLRAEFALVHRLEHPNVIRYHELFEHGEKVYLVMELCVGENLEAFVASKDPQRILRSDKGDGDGSASRTAYLSTIHASIKQTLEALDYLASEGVAHHDVKPGNLLLRHGDGAVKLCDFGVAESYGQVDRCGCFYGTPTFQPPEIAGNVSGEAFSGAKADVWSAGVTLYHLLTGTYPYTADTVYLLLKRIAEEPPEPLSIGDRVLEDFVSRLLERDPAKRPTAKEALEHPWIRNFNHQSKSLDSFSFGEFLSRIGHLLTPSCIKKQS